MKKDDGSATTFGYSPDGIVRTKQWVTSSPQTTQKRRYVYDRTLPYAQLLQEWDNVGNAVMADYLYLDGDLIGFKDERSGSVARYWVLKDGQNSVRKVVDASASVVASYDYTAFGEVLNQTQPSGWIFNHRAFGEVYDANLEMTYLRARWMDPNTGRFEPRDPFRLKASDPYTVNRYIYAGSSPTMHIDPTGLDFGLTALLVSIAIGGILAIGDIAHAKADENIASIRSTLKPYVTKILEDSHSLGGAESVGAHVRYYLADSKLIGRDIYEFLNVASTTCPGSPAEPHFGSVLKDDGSLPGASNGEAYIGDNIRIARHVLLQKRECVEVWWQDIAIAPSDAYTPADMERYRDRIFTSNRSTFESVTDPSQLGGVFRLTIQNQENSAAFYDSEWLPW